MLVKRRVVITGLGVISPIGVGKEAFWQNLLAGISGARSLDQVTCCSLFGRHLFQAQVVCEVVDFDPVKHQVPPEYRDMDRYIQFALAGARQAIDDARLDRVNPDRAGVVLATAICGTQTLDKEFTRVTDWGSSPVCAQDVSPHLYTAAMGNSAAIAVATHYGLRGECITLSTGCIAGVDAISYAYESIACGDHDVMIAGATEAPITPITIAAFDIIHCLSHHNEEPATASRPFCASRDGFVLSEGCGIVLLEELEHARGRHAPIYAELAGWSVTEHATHMTDMSVDGRDLARAFLQALNRANLVPAAVDFVNAHGTSTPQNDLRETQAIKTALGSRAYEIPINSTKSMIGHALAAASAIEVVACALSLHEQMVHPTINYDDPDPLCDLDYVPQQARHRPMQWLLTDASGFSGLHAALVMGQYRENEERLP
jgi:3-oxoacyl-(acyl-carrier-protein) synthase